MPFLKVCVALYDYDANTEEELTIKENDVLYLLEDDDPEWWKAKLKTADPNELLVGLIPSNYVEPVGPPAIHSLEHIHSSTFTRFPCSQAITTTQHTIPHRTIPPDYCFHLPTFQDQWKLKEARLKPKPLKLISPTSILQCSTPKWVQS